LSVCISASHLRNQQHLTTQPTGSLRYLNCSQRYSFTYETCWYPSILL